MRNSRLKKKSPAFRQGYRTGREAVRGVVVTKEYDRGYQDGRANGEQEATDLTLAGAAIIALISGAISFTVGFFIAIAL